MNSSMTGGAGASASGGAEVDLYGTWTLEVKTPIGQHPATLTLSAGADGAAGGAISSQLGDAQLSELRLDGDNFEAAISLTLQGRPYDARVSGQVTGGQMIGTIKINMPIAPPLKFTGTKAVSGQ